MCEQTSLLLTLSLASALRRVRNYTTQRQRVFAITLHLQISAIREKQANMDPFATITAPVHIQPKALSRATSCWKLLAASVAAFFLFGAQLSCTPAQQTAIEHALWDCTVPDRADAVAVLTPFAQAVIKSAASADGKSIDTSKIEASVSKAHLSAEGIVLLQCAFASAFAILETSTSAVTAAASLAQAPLDPMAVRATWAKIDAEQFDGARFKTLYGVQ